MDESVDYSDVSELTIVVKAIDSNFGITEEMFRCVPLYGTTKGEDIFNAVTEAFKDITFNKLSGICTDGAPAMVGKKIGFVGLMKSSVYWYRHSIALFISNL